MSFAHDIVMCTDTIVTPQPKELPNKNKNQLITQPSLKNELAASKSVSAANATQVNSQQIAHPNNVPTQNVMLNSQATDRDYKDPLRELVLISEAICINDTTYLTNVKSLAKEASVLEHVKEVLPEQAGQMPVCGDGCVDRVQQNFGPQI